MHARFLMVVLAAAPAAAYGQGIDHPAPDLSRAATVVAGVGNSMGWFGLQGEKYLRNDQLSVFGGLGYTPQLLDGDAEGITVAAGVRGYTPGVKHRGFLEVSVSQIETERNCFSACHRPYGPGVQAGYQYAARGGFTLSLSGGVGYAPGGSSMAVGLIGIGLGYTWRQ